MLPLLLTVALAEPACEPTVLLATQPQADRVDVPINTPIAYQARFGCGQIGMQLYRGTEFIAEAIPERDAAGIGRLLLLDGELHANTEHRLVLIDEAAGEVLADFTFTTGDRVALIPDTPPVIADFEVELPEKFGRELVLTRGTVELLVADPDGVSNIVIDMVSPIAQPIGIWLSDGSGGIAAETGELLLSADTTEVCVGASRLLGLAEPAASEVACAPVEPLGGCSHGGGGVGWLGALAGLLLVRRGER